MSRHKQFYYQNPIPFLEPERPAQDVTLYRDFDSWCLCACGIRRGGIFSGSRFTKLIREPISHKDLALIGGLPIPPEMRR